MRLEDYFRALSCSLLSKHISKGTRTVISDYHILLVETCLNYISNVSQNPVCGFPIVMWEDATIPAAVWNTVLDNHPSIDPK